MRRFIGKKGTICVLHFDHTADDSSGYTFYNVAYSHGGTNSTATDQVCTCTSWNTTSETGITGTPFTHARRFDASNNSFATINRCNSSVFAANPWHLDVASPSVEAWIRPDSFVTGLDQAIAGYYPDSAVGGYMLYISSTGQLTFALRDGGGSEETASLDMSGYSPGQWYYLAATYDGANNVRFYVNGDHKLTSAVTLGAITYGSQNSADLGTVGVRQGSGDYFTGYIASVRISGAIGPVSPWEIYNVYNADSDPSIAWDSTGAQMVYNLDDDTDPNATDTVTDTCGTADGEVQSDIYSDTDEICGPIGGYTETTRLGHRLASATGHWTVADSLLGSTVADDKTLDSTVEVWVSTDDEDFASANQYIIGKRETGYAYASPVEMFVETSGSGNLVARVQEVSAHATARSDHKALQDRVNYLAMTWDASERRIDLYLNGTHIAGEANGAIVLASCSNSKNLMIGHVHNATPLEDLFFFGQIHKLRFSAGIKTGAQLLTEYTGFTPTEDNG